MDAPTDLDFLVVEVGSELRRKSNDFADKIKACSVAAHSLQVETSKAVIANTNLVSQAQAKIRTKDEEIKLNQIKIAGEETALKTAQATLHNAQLNANAEQENLSQYKKNYKNAQHKCLGKKRRKRGGIFGGIKKTFKKALNLPKKITKGFTKVVRLPGKKPGGFFGKILRKAVKLPGKKRGGFLGKVLQKLVKLPKKIIQEAHTGICKGLNSINKNISKAKKKLHNARGHVRDAAAAVASKQAQVTSARNSLAALVSARTAPLNQKTQLEGQLAVLKTKRDHLITIDGKMQRIVTFIDGISARAEVIRLAVEYEYLLDLEGLINPLAEVGEQMMRLTGKPIFVDLGVSPAGIETIRTQIQALKATIPGYITPATAGPAKPKVRFMDSVS